MPLRDDLYATLNSLPQISRLSVNASLTLAIDARIDVRVPPVMASTAPASLAGAAP